MLSAKELQRENKNLHEKKSVIKCNCQGEAKAKKYKNGEGESQLRRSKIHNETENKAKLLKANWENRTNRQLNVLEMFVNGQAVIQEKKKKH